MSVIVTILLLIALVFGAWEMIKFIFRNMAGILFTLFFLFLVLGAVLSG